MPERKLPVVYAVVDVDTGEFKSAHRAKESSDRVAEVEHICDPRHEFETVEYIPRAQANEVVTCGECKHWYQPPRDADVARIFGPRAKECIHDDGLRKTKADGSSSCSYAERKARGE